MPLPTTDGEDRTVPRRFPLDHIRNIAIIAHIDACKVKITGNVENCEGCGQCPIKELLEVSRKYDVELAVATGGTIARRIVVQKRPRLIIAVACERDLTSGIQDTYPLPIYGIFNRRPHGPCFNTGLPLAEVEGAIRHFLDTSES